MSQPRRLTDDQLTALQRHIALIDETLPWTPTTDREGPDHPWVDVWGGDGDLLLEVGENLAYGVMGPDLADALVSLASHASAVVDELCRVRGVAAKLADRDFVNAWMSGVWQHTTRASEANLDAQARRFAEALIAEVRQLIGGPDGGKLT